MAGIARAALPAISEASDAYLQDLPSTEAQAAQYAGSTTI